MERINWNNGMIILQGTPLHAVMLDTKHKFYGWLFYQHPDGQWVSKRKLKDWELIQAVTRSNIVNDMDKQRSSTPLMDLLEKQEAEIDEYREMLNRIANTCEWWDVAEINNLIDKNRGK